MALAFEGIRVADFTQVLSGPVATYHLGLLGAEVIKIESVGGGDIARPMLDLANVGKGELAPIFLGANVNKRSIAVDLKRPEGRAVAERIVAASDVLVQNFRPGVMDRLGFGYAAVKRLRPDIVYCAISGYGQEGPRSGAAAFDGAIQAASGLMSLTGHPSTGPTRVGPPILDVTSGLMAAFAIAGALLRRSRSGEGQLLDVAMLDSAVTLLSTAFNNYFATGAVPELNGNLSLTKLPTADTFPTRDGWINVTVITQPHVARLLEVLGLGGLLADPRFASEEAQTRNAAALKAEIMAVLAEADTAVWLERLRAAGLPVAPIATIPDVLADAQLTHRRLTVTLPAPDLLDADTVTTVTTGFQADRDGPDPRRAAPRVGEHTEAILREHGYPQSAIAELLAAGVVRRPEPRAGSVEPTDRSRSARETAR